MTVRESGRDAVMVNCNPETVSTDYDTSDRLYFEPLTLEDVLGDRRGRAARGRDRPVRRPDAAQARRRPGGRRRAAARHPAGGDRPRRGPRALRRAARASSGCSAPPYATAHSAAEALAAAPGIGFPLLVRPSYVLGGRAMEIVYDLDGLRDYLQRVGGERRREIFLDRFLENAIEVDVDAHLRRRGRLDRRRSCSTSRRPGSTPATRPACCRRTRSAPRCWARSARRRAGSRSRSASSG